MGWKRCPQKGRPPTGITADEAAKPLRSLLHPQDYGDRTEFPYYRAKVSNKGPELSGRQFTALSLYALLLLYLERSAGPDVHVRRLIPTLLDHFLGERASLH